MSHLSVQIDSIANTIEFLQHIADEYDVCPSRDEVEPDNPGDWERLLEIIPEWDEQRNYHDIWFGYTDDVLDIVFETKRHLDLETVPTYLRYIVTTGGPHIEIVANLMTDRLTVEGYWGTEKCVRGIVAEGLYTHMAHYADMMCDTLNNY